MSEGTSTSLYVVTQLGAEIQNWFVKVILYLPKILWSGAILLFSVYFANLISNSVKKILKKTALEKTYIQIIGLIVYWLIFILGSLFALDILGLKGIVASIIAGAGFTSVIIAFGTQDISKNLISGIFILLGKQFRVGDNITVQGGFDGIVRRVTLRAIVLETTDGRLITVPNSTMFTQVVTNLTSNGRRKVTLDFKLKPTIDFKQVEKELIDILLAQMSVFKKPSPEILLNEITGKYYLVSVNYWTDSSPMMQRRSVSEINLVLSNYIKSHNLFSE